ncbi:MAG: hypothetical protein ACKOCW_09035, partial [Planctomycetaceae bacterium]
SLRSGSAEGDAPRAFALASTRSQGVTGRCEGDGGGGFDGPVMGMPGCRLLSSTHKDPGWTVDLAADPGEYRDLAAERPARAQELQARLAAWRTATAAALPTPNPEPGDPFGPTGVRKAR